MGYHQKTRNVFTVCATLPAAIGIAIINALGFYMAFQASPIVFALAVIVFISTMVAIMAMMGKRLYESYPRWCFYVNDLYKKRTPIMINGLIVSAVILGLSMSAFEIPLIMTFCCDTFFLVHFNAMFSNAFICLFDDWNQSMALAGLFEGSNWHNLRDSLDYSGFCSLITNNRTSICDHDCLNFKYFIL